MTKPLTIDRITSEDKRIYKINAKIEDVGLTED